MLFCCIEKYKTFGFVDYVIAENLFKVQTSLLEVR